MQQQIAAKRIAGISARCSNEQPEKIGELWDRFFAEGVPQRVGGEGIYSVYFDYESDHTAPFTLLIGSAIAADAPVPESLSEVTIEPGTYQSFDASGPRPQSILDGWKRIWDENIPRLRKTDFEEYGPAEDATIFVGIQP